jgi:hypothetical protein
MKAKRAHPDSLGPLCREVGTGVRHGPILARARMRANGYGSLAVGISQSDTGSSTTARQGASNSVRCASLSRSPAAIASAASYAAPKAGPNVES